MNWQLGNEAIRSQLHATIEEFAADGYTQRRVLRSCQPFSRLKGNWTLERGTAV